MKLVIFTLICLGLFPFIERLIDSIPYPIGLKRNKGDDDN